MAASNVCWGIELGAGAVKAIKLQRDGDEVRILEFADIPHKKVLSTPELDQLDATRVAMGLLVSQHDLTGASIAISVPGHSSFARFAKLPPVEPKKIPDIVKFEAVQQIPFPIDQVEWDYQVFASPDNPDVEVGIFAVTRDKIQERLSMWHEVGVAPDFVTIGPLAAYNAIAFDQQFNDKTPGTVILDVGTTSTDLIICEPGRLWVRTFPIGGHQFTEALVGAFKLSYQKAEALKRQAEQSKHARHVLQALRPVFGDLAQDVQRSIGYYQSSHKDANLTRLIGLGSTFNLPGLRKYLGQILQMEVIRLDKYNRLTLDGPRAAEFEAATINFATAYGLALQGLGFKHGVMANLVPIGVVREQVWRKKTKWIAVAAGLSIAAGAVSFYRPVVDAASNPTSNKPAVIAQTAGMITKLKGRWKQVSDEFKPDYRATNIAQLLEHRDIHAFLLNDLGLMLKSANEKAAADVKPEDKNKDPMGFAFVAYHTKFGSGAEGEPPAGAKPPTTPPAGEAAATQKVNVQLDLKTARTDPDRFVVQTIMTWLKQNTDRESVPYVIDPKGLRYDMEKYSVTGETNAEGAGAGGNQPAPPPDDRTGMGNRGRGRGGGRGGAPPPDRDPAPGSGGTGGAGGTGPDAKPLDEVAPIPMEPAFGVPGHDAYIIHVYYDVIVRDKNKEKEKAAKTESKT